MKIVNLHGKLAEKFGSRWELEINSISEALRAINANTGDFFDYLSEKQEENKTFSFILEDCKQKIETVEEILTPLPKKCTEFHIMPNAEGGMAEIAVPLAISVITGVIIRALFKPPKPEEEKQSKSFLFFSICLFLSVDVDLILKKSSNKVFLVFPSDICFLFSK